TESSPHSYTGMMSDPFFGRPVGLGGLAAAALQARAWIEASGAPARALAEVAAKNRTNGARNPLAHLREAVSVEEVEASPVAASPLRTLEVSPASDGAAAMVVAVEERAREIHPRPVWIEGAGYSHDLAYPGHRNLARLKSCREASERAFRMARVRSAVRQTNFAEVSECFAHQELMLYEALGLAPAGEAARFLDSGATRPDGDYPVNPSGGALCGDPGVATGLARVGEVCLQLWRKAGAHQLEPAPTRGVAHAASGLAMQSNLVYVLGTDRE
ncbi:MAG: thiolase family protein, partial [Planctomycetes bacterium]|nr:thiolase family protein [Planctomycetota bacterium]